MSWRTPTATRTPGHADPLPNSSRFKLRNLSRLALWLAWPVAASLGPPSLALAQDKPEPDAPAAGRVPLRRPQPRAMLDHRDLGVHPVGLHGLAFSPDGATLAMNFGDPDTDIPGTIVLWDVAANRRRNGRQGRPDTARYLAFSPDGRTLADGGRYVPVDFWDLPALTLRAGVGRRGQPEDGGLIRSLAFSPDGSTLAALIDTRTVRLWDVGAARELDPPAFPDPRSAVEALAFGPEGGLRLLLKRGGDWVAREREKRLRAEGHPLGPDEAREAKLQQSRFDELRLWEAKERRVAWTLQTPYPARHVEFSPDGSRLVRILGAHGESIVLLDARDGREVLTLTNRATVVEVIISGDGRRLAARSNMTEISDEFTRAGMITLWDLATGRELAAFVADESAVGTFALSPDGRILATHGTDRTVKLWAVAEILNAGR